MNSDDYALLGFLINADQTNLQEWYKQTSDEELIRANFLLDLYRNYLEQIRVLDEIDMTISNMSVLTEAQAVIASVQ